MLSRVINNHRNEANDAINYPNERKNFKKESVLILQLDVWLSLAPSPVLLNKCILQMKLVTTRNYIHNKTKPNCAGESERKKDAKILFSMSLPYDLTKYMDYGKNVNIDD